MFLTVDANQLEMRHPMLPEFMQEDNLFARAYTSLWFNRRILVRVIYPNRHLTGITLFDARNCSNLRAQ